LPAFGSIFGYDADVPVSARRCVAVDASSLSVVGRGFGRGSRVLDYFFVPPLFTLAVGSPGDVVALATFLRFRPRSLNWSPDCASKQDKLRVSEPLCGYAVEHW